VRFGILGPVEVADDHSRIMIGGRQPRSLLAALLCHPNRTVSTETLLEAVWGTAPPKTAGKNLQACSPREIRCGSVPGCCRWRRMLEASRRTRPAFVSRLRHVEHRRRAREDHLMHAVAVPFDVVMALVRVAAAVDCPGPTK